MKSWLIGKDPDAGRDWGQEEKGTTEDEMAGWHHWLDGREFEWTLTVGNGQGGLVCCNSWGCKESDTTEWLNWTELNWKWKNWLVMCDSVTSWAGSIVRGILQVRILEWVASPLSRGCFHPRGWTRVSFTAGRFFTSWATDATTQRNKSATLAVKSNQMVQWN